MGRHRRDPMMEEGAACPSPSPLSRPSGVGTIPKRGIRSQADRGGCRYDFGVGFERLGGPQPRSLTGPIARRAFLSFPQDGGCGDSLSVGPWRVPGRRAGSGRRVLSRMPRLRMPRKAPIDRARSPFYSPGFLAPRLVHGRCEGRRSPGLMRLRCVECGRPSGPEARGWRMYRTDDEDEPDGEITVLAAYCRACGTREFGQTRAKRKEVD